MAKQIRDLAVLHRAASQAARIAKRFGIRAAVAGGYGASLQGAPSLTGDVDFVAEAVPEGFPPGKPLSFGGVRFKPVGTDVPVDWIVRADQLAGLYEEALEHAQHVEGASYLVVPLPYIAAMKFFTRRERDEVAIAEMITEGILDVSQTKKIVKKYGGWFARDEFDALVAESKWRGERDKTT